MGKEMVRLTIFGEEKEYEKGTQYFELVEEYQKQYQDDIVLVLVNNRLRELHKRIKKSGEVRFVTTADKAGQKTYRRSVTLLMQKALYNLLGKETSKVRVLHCISQAYYCELEHYGKPDQQLLDVNGQETMGTVFNFKYPWVTFTGVPYGLAINYDTPQEVNDYWFSDDFLEDMKLLKKWADLGFWSRSALSDTTDPFERYENGMFVCMSSGNNPNKFTTRVEAWTTSHPDWKTAYHTFAEGDGYVWSTTPTADATAITKDCKNPERAMKALELLVMDKELNLLTQYGIEGVNYEIAEDGTYKNLSPDFGYEALNAWSLRNPAYKLANGQGGVLMQEMFDHYTEVIEEKGTPSVDPFGGFSEDSSSYSAEKAAVETVWNEYGKPLEMGVVDDVETSVETLRQKLKEAGLDTVREGWKKQWLDYVEKNGL